MVARSSRTLEITVMSCENIRVTEEAYVVVRAESLKCCTTKMVKDNDNNNGDSSFLSWNEKFLLDVSANARSITFEVQSKKFKAVRPVAVARIAISDFLGGAVSENCLQVLSYRLRDWEGRQNGIIHFAVRVAAEGKTVTAAAEPVVACRRSSGNPFTGFKVGEENKSNEVVVGVPFWWNYPNTI